MNKSFLRFFQDPRSGDGFDLEILESNGDEIITGYLRSPKNSYPIVRGVPRFVEAESYTGSFGWQWNRWSRVQFDSENVGKPMQGHTAKMWERIVGIQPGANLTNQLVLDIGCGPGRFIDVARSKGATVIGIDYSNAVEAAAKNFSGDPGVCICQADALNLPFKEGVFGGAFTIGVLHHTPAPRKGVEEAHRVLSEGGWFAISVYGKGGYYDFPSVQAWRKLFKLLWPVFGPYLPLIYTYFTIFTLRPIAMLFPTFGKIIRLFLPFVKLPDIRWSLLDTFDSVTPSYQSAHESYEVFQWLKKSQFGEIEPADWGFTAYRGTKGGSA